MSTLTDEATYLNDSVSLLRAKINAKGASPAVTGSTPFRSLVAALDTIPASMSIGAPVWSQPYFDAVAAANAYVRPSSWLALPAVTLGQQKFVGLYAVFPESTFAVIQVRGGDFTVDWGDGVVENLVGGTSYHTHAYDFNTLTGSAIDRGYKQAIITVTPQAGQTLTIMMLSGTLPSGALTTWLDVASTGIDVYPGVTPLLEKVTIVGPLAATSISRLFAGCQALQSVSMNTTGVTDFAGLFGGCSLMKTPPMLDTSQGTSFSGMFSGCANLVTLPQYDTAQGLDLSYMFGGCSSLQTIPLLDTTKATSAANMFNGAGSLQTIPQLDTSSVTTFDSMFSACDALTEIPLLDTSSGTTFNGMFASSKSLTTIPLLDTSKGVNFAGMFLGCSNLTHIPLLNTALGQTFGSMFSECFMLAYIPLLNTANALDITSMFYDTGVAIIPALDFSNVTSASSVFYASTTGATDAQTTFSSMLAIGLKVNFDIPGGLSRAALVTVFNNLASGVTGKSIGVSSNWGYASLSAADKLIATNKGWTLR